MKVNILLVDDKPENLTALEASLENPEYSLFKAQSGEEALKYLMDEYFAVILLDIRMPGMDGLQTAEIIRQREKTRDTPIIFITAEHTETPNIKRAYELNASDFIFKPFDRFILQAKVAVFAELFRKTAILKEQGRLLKERSDELDRALADAEKTRDRIDGIIKSVADGLIVTDAYNRVILMNRAAEDLLGVRFSDVIDRPIDFAIREETLREKVKQTLERKTTGYLFDFELPGDDPKHPKIMRARTSVIHDREGKDSGIVTTIHDVTHEREVDRMKTEFISTAAHELRTPLTSIQGFSEILLMREDLKPEEKKKFLTYINQQSVGLAAIINDLLDISRIESGRGFALNKQPCNVGEAIQEIIPYFQEHYTNHPFEVALPEKPVHLNVDKEKMGQVLKNLLSNAAKYSPEGGLIRVGGEIFEDHYRISVQDRGMGMTPEQVDKMFDKFYRGDASNTAIEGTGLGMTVVKHIVEAHGGKVWAESELGKGTVVTFTIPV